MKIKWQAANIPSLGCGGQYLHFNKGVGIRLNKGTGKYAAAGIRRRGIMNNSTQGQMSARIIIPEIKHDVNASQVPQV